MQKEEISNIEIIELYKITSEAQSKDCEICDDVPEIDEPQSHRFGLRGFPCWGQDLEKKMLMSYSFGCGDLFRQWRVFAKNELIYSVVERERGDKKQYNCNFKLVMRIN